MTSFISLPEIFFIEIAKWLTIHERFSLLLVKKVIAQRFLPTQRQMVLKFTPQEWMKIDLDDWDDIRELVPDPSSQLSLQLLSEDTFLPSNKITLPISSLYKLYTNKELFSVLLPQILSLKELTLVNLAKNGGGHYHASESESLESGMSDPSSLEVILEQLAEKCEQLSSSFSLTDVTVLHDPHLSHFPKLLGIQSLTLKYFPYLQTFDPSYSQLQQLTFEGMCTLQDISLFGKVYSLKLKNCHSITDISALTHNVHIWIEFCHEILDYSQSFQYSQYITLLYPSEEAEFQFDHYQAMKSLVLHFEQSCESFPVFPKQWPSTLRMLEIGNFSSTRNRSNSLNPTATTNTTTTTVPLTLSNVPSFEHSIFCHLQVLLLQNCQNITTIDAFVHIPILQFLHLPALESLEALRVSSDVGIRKTRKVVIGSCDAIHDFSPLNGINTVEIIHCIGFKDATTVKDVPRLLIDHCHYVSSISFASLGKVQELTIARCPQLLSWDGLEMIPRLHLIRAKGAFIPTFTAKVNHQLLIIESKEGEEEFMKVRESLFLAMNYHFVMETPESLYCYRIQT